MMAKHDRVFSYVGFACLCGETLWESLVMSCDGGLWSTTLQLLSIQFHPFFGTHLHLNFTLCQYLVGRTESRRSVLADLAFDETSASKGMVICDEEESLYCYHSV